MFLVDNNLAEQRLLFVFNVGVTLLKTRQRFEIVCTHLLVLFFCSFLIISNSSLDIRTKVHDAGLVGVTIYHHDFFIGITLRSAPVVLQCQNVQGSPPNPPLLVAKIFLIFGGGIRTGGGGAVRPKLDGVGLEQPQKQPHARLMQIKYFSNFIFFNQR